MKDRIVKNTSSNEFLDINNLSENERWLLEYLEGSHTEKLMELDGNSTLRLYGELACIGEYQLMDEV